MSIFSRAAGIFPFRTGQKTIQKKHICRFGQVKRSFKRNIFVVSDRSKDHSKEAYLSFRTDQKTIQKKHICRFGQVKRPLQRKAFFAFVLISPKQKIILQVSHEYSCIVPIWVLSQSKKLPTKVLKWARRLSLRPFSSPALRCGALCSGAEVLTCLPSLYTNHFLCAKSPS